MGVLERKLKEKERRRNDILNSAKKVLFKNGYAGSSMEMIADSAQLSKGTIYLYFNSKDDLYLTLLEEGLRLLKKMFADAAHSAGDDFLKSIVKIAEAYAEYAIKYSEFFVILMNSNRDETKPNVKPCTYETLKELGEDTIYQVIEVLQNGIKTGYFTPNVNACYMAIQLWVSLTGAIEMCRLKNKPHLLESIDLTVLVGDITRSFLISFCKKGENAEKLRMEILENAVCQAPDGIVNHINKYREKEN